MSRHDRVMAKVLWGSSDANISFRGLCQLLRHLGFQERVRGSHHIFISDNIIEILNLQSTGSKAKAYQVKQVRDVLLKYNLGEVDDA